MPFAGAAARTRETGGVKGKVGGSRVVLAAVPARIPAGQSQEAAHGRADTCFYMPRRIRVPEMSPLSAESSCKHRTSLAIQPLALGKQPGGVDGSKQYHPPGCYYPPPSL